MKTRNKLLFFLALVVIFILGNKTKVQAATCYIDNLNLQATIQENGDLEIEQTLQYVFNGYHSGIYINIPTTYQNEWNVSSEIPHEIYNASGVIVQNVSVFDNHNNEYYYTKTDNASKGDTGVYTVENDDGLYKLEVYSPSTNTKKTFKIKYIVQNVCVEHEDIGELYYNFIGGNWKSSIKKLNINIFLTNNQDDIKIWGHGPNKGHSKIINKQHAYFNVNNVAIGKNVSARVIFNKSNIPNATKKSNLNAYDIIYKDEQKNAKSSDIKDDYTRNIYLFSLFLLVYWIILLIKYEKDKKIDMVPYNEDELLKKYNPMEAGCLQGSRDVLARDIIAVILNLIEKGNIKLQIEEYYSKMETKINKLYIISKNPEKSDEMDEIEKKIYDWVFKSDDKVELTQRLKDIPKEKNTRRKFNELNELTQSRLNKLGANQKTVSIFIRGFNILLFFITIYISIVHTLHEGVEIYDDIEFWYTMIVMAFVTVLPIFLLLIYGILRILSGIKGKINKLVNKITGQRVVKTTVTIIAIFLIIIILTAILNKGTNRYMIADEVLICISLIIMLTDNLMMKNSVKMIEDFSKINSFKEKIENYTMMEDRDIEQVNLWGKYLAYAVSFGIASKLNERMKELSLNDDLLSLLNDKDFSDYILTGYRSFYFNSNFKSEFMRRYGNDDKKNNYYNNNPRFWRKFKD